MSTPSGNGSRVSNEIIAVKLDALTSEVRELRRELVRRDVYEAQRAADQAQIEVVKGQLADQSRLRRQVVLSFVGAALALLVALIRPSLGV